MIDGNVIANRNSTNRSKTDFCPTPAEVTIALLRYLNLPHSTRIWEPACGEGHMAETFKEQGYPFVIASEFDDMGYGCTGIDYLITPMPPCDWIITNPPFSLSEEFIKRSIEHGKPFALLFKSQYWHAAGRLKIFTEYKPEAVLPLTWRPNFLFTNTNRKNGKPLMEVYWTVWGDHPATRTLYQPLEKPIKGRYKKQWLN